MTINEAKKIPLDAFLEANGISLSKVCNDGQDKWFLSPFRFENTPSLHISVRNNIWFDFGKTEGVKGGSIIDFCLEYFPLTTIKEVLEKLETDFSSFQQPQTKTEGMEVNKKVLSSKIKIVDIEELSHEPLITYLAKRGIDIITAQKYCKQIGYVNNDKYFKSIGFQNQSGGFELRSEGFKSCTSPKDITFIDNGCNDKLAVFEGFIDFLSYQMLPLFFIENANWLILNSLSFIKCSYKVCNEHKQVFLFLDNDAAGQKAVSMFQARFPLTVNMSVFYTQFKDLNDYLNG